MNAERELEEIKVAYLQSYETGHAPTLEDLLRRHPEYGDELFEFVVSAVELQSALKQTPEVAEPSRVRDNVREAAMLCARGITTLRETLVSRGVSRDQIAEAVNLPVSFIVMVERGRLIPDDDPIIATFAEKVARSLGLTAQKVADILMLTYLSPSSDRRMAHARRQGKDVVRKRRKPQRFIALLLGCSDLTEAQRSEWVPDECE